MVAQRCKPPVLSLPNHKGLALCDDCTHPSLLTDISEQVGIYTDWEQVVDKMLHCAHLVAHVLVD